MKQLSLAVIALSLVSTVASAHTVGDQESVNNPCQSKACPCPEDAKKEYRAQNLTSIPSTLDTLELQTLRAIRNGDCGALTALAQLAKRELEDTRSAYELKWFTAQVNHVGSNKIPCCDPVHAARRALEETRSFHQFVTSSKEEHCSGLGGFVTRFFGRHN